MLLNSLNIKETNKTLLNSNGTNGEKLLLTANSKNINGTNGGELLLTVKSPKY